MAYNTRRKQGGGRGNPVTPARGNHHLQQRPIIEQGCRKVQLNSCMLNAHTNALTTVSRGSWLLRVKDSNPAFVRIAVGSMGFRSDDGWKTHWEYGGVGWNEAHQFDKGGGLAWDAHAWAIYTNTRGEEVIIDPYFSAYANYARQWGIKTTDVSASRVYQELTDEKERAALFDGMVATTKRHERDAHAMTKCAIAWNDVEADSNE